MAVLLNKNSFCRIRIVVPFCIKTTFARIDFLRQGARLVSGKGTHNVKFLTENQTKQVRHIQAYDNGTERMYAYDRQHEWLQGMLSTANGDRIIETQ